MLEVSKERVVAVLEQLGIQSGDNLLIHSAIQYLGRPAGGVAMYWQAVQAVIGPQGTVTVPTYSFAFAKGKDYDPASTPSDGMGSFSEFIRRLPQARRTPHPMQSLAVIGPLAADLAVCETPGAFDPGSAFDRMLELDFKLLLLGASVHAVSMVHYSEQRAEVPYRYWKTFSGRVRGPGGWEQRSYRMFVRDLEINPRLTLEPIQAALETRGEWRAVPLNYGHVSACRLSDFAAAADRLLAEDPWALVEQPHDIHA